MGTLVFFFFGEVEGVVEGPGRTLDVADPDDEAAGGAGRDGGRGGGCRRGGGGGERGYRDQCRGAGRCDGAGQTPRREGGQVHGGPLWSMV